MFNAIEVIRANSPLGASFVIYQGPYETAMATPTKTLLKKKNNKINPHF